MRGEGTFAALLVKTGARFYNSALPMTQWQDYAATRAGPEHTVVGNLKVLPGLHGPQLDNGRDILLYLPPSYELGTRRYPVLYFQDGQNLFDAATSFAGEWQVDETMEALSRNGVEAIVVGIPNAGTARLDEYSPFPHPRLGGGQGEHYLQFLIETVKRRVDSDFRTCPDPAHTGILGSSMGGLISLYAFFKHSDVFGLVGALSPSLWFGQRAIYGAVRQAAFNPGRIYLDVGTREHGSGKTQLLKHSRRYYASVRRMHRLLAKKGYRPRRDLLYVEEKWARHEEQAWARRLPRAIRFLLDAADGSG
ncbi:MAG: alpha/beta hydrolase-fold protein [Candidatus Promineifilaceae bacterium]|nr:alpha/beta hydrolase-fold protein [Candidatus Promineifilaceae bacterium]